MQENPDQQDTPGVRTAPEAMTLLAELARVLKGRRFYPPGDPALALLFERAVRTWQADLTRHGIFEVTLEGDALRIPALGASGEVAGQFSGLVRTLGGRDVERLRVEPGIDAEAFAGLVEVLVADVGTLQAEGGVARALAMRAPDGIRVNGVEPLEALSARPARSRPRPAPAAPPPEPMLPEPTLEPPARSVIDETPTLELDPPPASDQFRLDTTAPDLGPASARSDRFRLESTLPDLEEPLELDESGESEPPLEFDSEPHDDLAAAANAETNPFLATTAPDLGEAPSATDDGGFEFETLEEAPAAASTPEPSLTQAVEPPPAPALVPELLEELDVSESGPCYTRLVERVTAAIELLVEQGHEPAAFPALVRLSEHAGDGEKRAPMDRDSARSALERLATGPCFAGLVDRATGQDASSLAATQILTGLGGDAAGPLLREAARERSAERRERMHGLLIALGEAAIPELLRAMEGDASPRLRTAVRLAGEIQSPLAVERLAALLESPSAGLAQEVAKALVRIGDAGAIEALVRAIGSPVDPVPMLAVQALGTSGSERAAEALLATLEQASQVGRSDLAREAIRSLGRLGRREAVPALAELLLRRSFFKRRQLRELKLAAASALGRLPGDEAVGALAQAAQVADAQIRRAAQMALDRRAHALASR